MHVLPKDGYVKYYFYILLVAALLSAVSYTHLDLPAALYFNTFRDWYPLASLLTDLGDSALYLIPTGVVGLALSLWRWRTHLNVELEKIQYYSLYIFTLVASIGLFNNVLKILFGRARPRQFFREGEYGFFFFRIDSDYGSFPSGHSCTFGVLAAIAVLLGGRSAWLVVPVGLTLASTRVIVGSHYPGDVVMGYALGFILALIGGKWLQQRYYARFTKA